MQFANGLVFGAGFTTAAIIIIAISRAVFHLGICG